MSLNINREVVRMKAMKTSELKDYYTEVLDRPPRSHNRDSLIKRIAWRLQANEEGDLPERVRLKALALADDADLRVRPGKEFTAAIDEAKVKTSLPSDEQRDPRLPLPGSEISRVYKGRLITVLIGKNDFEFNGDVYKSLSAIAKAVTGSHVNGFAFFKLRKPKESNQ
ncbi:MAG: DUF2924 domain-containing protein [Planctomycetota bacterium]